MSDSKSNIKFNYLYRDAGNYKVWGFEVFSNPDSLTLEHIEQAIRKSLIDGEFFDPKYCKVKRLKHDDWIAELDHTWNEFDSVEYTDEFQTCDVSINEILESASIATKY